MNNRFSARFECFKCMSFRGIQTGKWASFTLFGLLLFVGSVQFSHAQESDQPPDPEDVTTPLMEPTDEGETGETENLTPGTPGTEGTPGTGATPGTPGTPGTAPTQGPSLNINFNPGEKDDVGVAIQILFVMTLLTLAPSIVIMMTSFTRIVIVLGFIRTAVGTQQAPTSQVIVGMALFLTFFIMGPTLEDIYDDAIVPYMNEEIISKEALGIATEYLKGFMLTQTEPRNVDFFLGIAGMGPTTAEDLPIRVVVPAFILSELKTAFTMGFMIFVPFLVIDFLAASILMSMGMMMMPPIIISLPFKILLFVLVDGWYLIVRSLVLSF